MKKDCDLSGNDDKLTIEKGKFKLSFNQKYNWGDSFLLRVTINPKTETGMSAMQHGKKMQYKDLHKCLGHAGEAKVRATANRMGWILTGASVCQHCNISKVKQKSVLLEASNHSNIAGE